MKKELQFVCRIQQLICYTCTYPNEWCTKNVLHSGDLNPQPLERESSALTIRRRVSSNSKLQFEFK